MQRQVGVKPVQGTKGPEIRRGFKSRRVPSNGPSQPGLVFDKIVDDCVIDIGCQTMEMKMYNMRGKISSVRSCCGTTNLKDGLKLKAKYEATIELVFVLMKIF